MVILSYGTNADLHGSLHSGLKFPFWVYSLDRVHPGHDLGSKEPLLIHYFRVQHFY